MPDEGVDVYELLEDKEVLDFIDKGNDYENKKYLIINESVPKFDVSSNQNISNALKELGITDAFDANKADFSPVTDEPVSIWVDSVEQGGVSLLMKRV